MLLLLYVSARGTGPWWDPRAGLYTVKINIADRVGKYFHRSVRGLVVVPTELFRLFYYAVKQKMSVYEEGVRFWTAVRLLATACFL